MGFIRPKKPSAPRALTGPSQADIQRAQEQAAERERLRLEQEQAAQRAEKEQAALTKLIETEKGRRAFAGQLTTGVNDENQRRRFLKGV